MTAKLSALSPLLSMRKGVTASCVVVTGNKQQELLPFLVARFPMVRKSDWLLRLEKGDVFNELGDPLKSLSIIKQGNKVYYFREVINEPHIPFQEELLFENEHLVVADKPHFLPVIPSGKYAEQTLLARLRDRLQLPDLSPIHRIDRDTAGVIVFCKRPVDRHHYQTLFQKKMVQKEYLAIAPSLDGVKDWPIKRMSRLVRAENYMQQQEIDGKPNSETLIDLIECHGKWSKYRLIPSTGQRHQLRVHMNALGAPIWGDGIYPVLTPEGSLDINYPLQLLAQCVSFLDPVTHAQLLFTSKRQLLSWDTITECER